MHARLGGTRSQWAAGHACLPALSLRRSRRQASAACMQMQASEREGGGQMIPVAACMAWHAMICGSLAACPASFYCNGDADGEAGRQGRQRSAEFEADARNSGW